MMRFKYVIFIIVVFLLLYNAFLWLFFAYLTGCHTSSNEFNGKVTNPVRNGLTNKFLSIPKPINTQVTSSENNDENLPYIYAITPTHNRLTQKADLTRLCQTFMHVKNFHWILIEDAESKRDVIARFLKKCGVLYTHLAIRTRQNFQLREQDPRWKKPRGVEQRNAGISWLRANLKRETANGVVYFVDDDNTYDLELFEQLRWTRKVSVWPVGLVGGMKWEGPICENGRVLKFWAFWKTNRHFPIDMAGFAINVKLFLDKPSVVIDINAPLGFLESKLLENFVSQDELEPLADNCKNILVWHTQTAEPKIKRMSQLSDPPMEV